MDREIVRRRAISTAIGVVGWSLFVVLLIIAGTTAWEYAMNAKPPAPLSEIAHAIARAATGEAADTHAPVRNKGESVQAIRRRHEAWERSRGIYEGVVRLAYLLRPDLHQDADKATARPVEASADAVAGEALCLDQARGRAAIALTDAGYPVWADDVLQGRATAMETILMIRARGESPAAGTRRALIRLAAIEQGDTIIARDR